MNLKSILSIIIFLSIKISFATSCPSEVLSSHIENISEIHIFYKQDDDCKKQKKEALILKGRIEKTMELAIDFSFNSKPVTIILENANFNPHYDKSGRIYLPFSISINGNEILGKNRQAIIIHEYAHHVIKGEIQKEVIPLQRFLKKIESLSHEKFELKQFEDKQSLEYARRKTRHTRDYNLFASSPYALKQNSYIEHYEELFADYFSALILNEKHIFTETLNDEYRNFKTSLSELKSEDISNAHQFFYIVRNWLGTNMWTPRHYGKIPYVQKVLTATIQEIQSSITRKNKTIESQNKFLIKEIESIDILDKKLTPDWSLEYSGNDLVRMEISSNGNENEDYIPVTVIDSGFTRKAINVPNKVRVDSKTHRNRNVADHHGTNVANVINHSRFGGSEKVQLNLLAKAMYDFNYSYILDESLKQSPKTRIISNSLGWRTDSVSKVAERAHEQDILWFLASGNDFPKRVNPWESESKAILVGSYSPSGLVTNSTQIDKNVVILAPADHYQQTINAHNEISSFGETSGATPMVAATVANWLSIFSNLKRNDVITILKSTALKTIQNGEHLPGQLNSYKGYLVVKELKETCPDEQRSCIDENLKRIITKKRTNSYIAICENDIQSENFLNQRRAYFLDEDNLEVITLLRCGYEKAGYTKNSEFFALKEKMKTSINAVIDHINEMAIASLKSGLSNAPYYRNVNILNEEFIQTLKDIEVNDYGVGSYFATQLLSRYVQVKSKEYLMNEYDISESHANKFFQHTSEENTHY
ncbi:S8/S53 family peptidase [Halobacteriovorax sp. GB3]|uniref:S8/S53 family peptidase n=1 Tax=Halobacteriovorax sp. GB3 TaxID=2719615 RepID=UPI00235EEE25|nr:S8/S53 family peptidase [Halobacteriovorax sp. GB3]MDD0852042.1 S8/S53 family peptidase [Halobacteriovorax sp. GB3]